MWRRFVLATVFATVFAFGAALAVPGATAKAGGWAVTTFDDLPGQFVAGQSYALGYTIRQHGVTPIKAESTGIYLQNGSGAIAASFPGAADGTLGHYVATVRFPAAGTFTWFVTQQPFGDQQLGPITIVPGAGQAQPAPPVQAAPAPIEPVAAPAAAAPVTTSQLATRVALGIATIAALAAFAWQLLRYRRRGALRIA